MNSTATDYGSFQRAADVIVGRRESRREVAAALAALAMLVVVGCVVVVLQEPHTISLEGGWTEILADEAHQQEGEKPDPCACPKCVPKVVVVDSGSSTPPNPLNPYNPLFDAKSRRRLLADPAPAAAPAAPAAAPAAPAAAPAAPAAPAAAPAATPAVELGPDGRPKTCAPCVCNPVVYDGEMGGGNPPNPLNPFNPLFNAKAQVVPLEPVYVEEAEPVVVDQY